MSTVHVLNQIKGHHCLEHWNFDHTAVPRMFSGIQRGEDSYCDHQSAGLVSADGRKITWDPGLTHHQVAIAAHTLNNIVVSGSTCVYTAASKAVQARIDNPWVDFRNGL